ncbi:MAG: hypothetical protein SFV15_03170 [Polyangiaceae bacterium]|nr:hypothetical protein [Polyangiaceae bacterium]
MTFTHSGGLWGRRGAKVWSYGSSALGVVVMCCSVPERRIDDLTVNSEQRKPEVAMAGSGGAPTTLGGQPSQLQTPAGGGVPGLITPEGIGSSEKCVSPNPLQGGAYAITCRSLQVNFVPPLRGNDYDVSVLTSKNPDVALLATPRLAGEGVPALNTDGVNTLGVWLDYGGGSLSPIPASAFPAWIQVTVERAGQVVVQTRWDTLQYQCQAIDPWRWCWQAAPLTATTSLAQMDAP